MTFRTISRRLTTIALATAAATTMTAHAAHAAAAPVALPNPQAQINQQLGDSQDGTPDPPGPICSGSACGTAPADQPKGTWTLNASGQWTEVPPGREIVLLPPGTTPPAGFESCTDNPGACTPGRGDGVFYGPKGSAVPAAPDANGNIIVMPGIHFQPKDPQQSAPADQQTAPADQSIPGVVTGKGVVVGGLSSQVDRQTDPWAPTTPTTAEPTPAPPVEQAPVTPAQDNAGAVDPGAADPAPGFDQAALDQAMSDAQAAIAGALADLGFPDISGP